tara:strand:- start:33 stop:458 length:426 start_codon:yes stop_codon:yes gene_type:complete
MKEVDVKILKIRISNFSFELNDDYDAPKLDLKDDLSYDIGSEIRVHREKKQLDVKMIVIINTKEERKKIIELSIITSFEIKEIEKFEKDGEAIALPNDLIVKLLNICIANLRGVLAVKVLETGYKNIIIPLIDFSDKIHKK